MLENMGTYAFEKVGGNPRISKLLEMTEFGHPVKESNFLKFCVTKIEFFKISGWLIPNDCKTFLIWLKKMDSFPMKRKVKN